MKQQKLTIGDYFALYKLSLRNFFWQVDGRQGVNKVRSFSALYLFTMFVVYGLPCSVIFGLVSMVQSLLTLPFISSMGGSAAMMPGASIGITLMGTFLFLVCSPLVCNFDRLKYNLRFTSSAWWRNTGIRPSVIAKSRDVYGEYIATLVAEQNLQNNGLYGRVYNTLLVPKFDGDFNEIDVVSINETGIHVIEAKAWGGTLAGHIMGEKWTQYMGEQVHEKKNPIRQNLGHINYLSDFLHRHLPEGSAKHKAGCPESFVNVVLLCLQEIRTNLDTTGFPTMTTFSLAEGNADNSYQKMDVAGLYGYRLTPEEVDAICALIEEYLTGNPQELVEALKLKREEERETGKFSHKNYYYLVKLRRTDAEGRTHTEIKICKDNQVYRTYWDAEDRLFKAIPNAVLLGRSHFTDDFGKVAAYYNRLAARGYC